MVPFAEKLVPQEVAPPLKEKVENTQRKEKKKKKKKKKYTIKTPLSISTITWVG